MIVLVYHVKDEHRLKVEAGEIAVGFQKNHELVAAVNTPHEGMAALDHAYNLTQNNHDSWAKNAEVDVKGITKPGGRRSTYIGDVLLGAGAAFVRAPWGWKELRYSDQKLSSGPKEGIVMRPPNNYDWRK